MIAVFDSSYDGGKPVFDSAYRDEVAPVGSKFQWTPDADAVGSAPSGLVNGISSLGSIADWQVVSEPTARVGKALKFVGTDGVRRRAVLPGTGTSGRVDMRGRFYAASDSSASHFAVIRLKGTSTSNSYDYHMRFNGRKLSISRYSTAWAALSESAVQTTIVGWWLWRYTFDPTGGTVHRLAIWRDGGNDSSPDVVVTSNSTTASVDGTLIGIGAFNPGSNDLFDWFTVGIDGADANITPVPSGAPVSFTGTVPSLSGQVGTAFNHDFSQYVSGGTPPYSYSIATGSWPAGVGPINSTTGTLSGTPTGTITSSGLSVKVTDSVAGTATSNTFSFSVAAAGTTLSVITDVDAGNIDGPSVVVDNPTDSSPTVTVKNRSAAGLWRHFLFAVDGAEGKTPLFRMTMAGRAFTAVSFTSLHKPHYTTDFINWIQAPSVTFGTYMQWSFSDPLPAGRIYVVNMPLGRGAEAAAFAQELLALPGATPTASANVNGIYAYSPAETDDLGRAVGNNPQYGIKVVWPGPTTDGAPKRKIVLEAGIHAAGEQHSWPGFVAAARWIATSNTPEAIAFRKNWDLYCYFNVNPNGLKGGQGRTTFRSTTDLNRTYTVTGSSAFPEISNLSNAVVADTGGSVDAFFSWHGAADTATKKIILILPPGEYSLSTRSARYQAFIDAITTIGGESPKLDDLDAATGGLSSTTDSGWAVEKLGAKISFAVENQSRGDSRLSETQRVGEAWIKSLQSVDSQGLISSNPVEVNSFSIGVSSPKATIVDSVSINVSTALIAVKANKPVIESSIIVYAGIASVGFTWPTVNISHGSIVSVVTAKFGLSSFPVQVSSSVSVNVDPAKIGIVALNPLVASDVIYKTAKISIYTPPAVIESEISIEFLPAKLQVQALPFFLTATDRIDVKPAQVGISGIRTQIWVGSDNTGPAIVPRTPDPGRGYVLPVIDQDHASIAWNNFLAQYADSPRLEAVARSLYAPVEVLSAALRDLIDSRGLDTADGKQLDGIGEIVGQGREIEDLVYIKFFGFVGQPNTGTFDESRMRSARESSTIAGSTTLLDAEYRKLLYWKIGLNNGHGTGPEIAASIRAIFDSTQVRIEDQGNARIGVWFNTTPQTNAAFLANPLRWIPVAAGVGVELLTDAERHIFGFINQGLFGFGDGSFSRPSRV